MKQLSKMDSTIFWFALAGLGVALMPAPNIKLTANFSVGEFNSKDGVPVPLALLPNLTRLTRELQKIRNRTGSRITIMSGFRSQAHNESVGGAEKSFHVLAMAADIKAPDYMGGDEKALHQLILAMIRSGELKNGGVGLYVRSGGAGWVHYDIRNSPARWNG